MMLRTLVLLLAAPPCLSLVAGGHRCGDVRMQVAPGTKLLVIGGNGYVGREVCKNAVQLGYAVTSLSRRGECPDANDPYLAQVDWRAGNALDKPTVKAAVGKADAVVQHVERLPAPPPECKSSDFPAHSGRMPQPPRLPSQPPVLLSYFARRRSYLGRCSCRWCMRSGCSSTSTPG